MNSILPFLLIVLLSFSLTFASEEDLAITEVLDSMSSKAYKNYGIKPPPKTTDYTFLRRVYLDIAGRIPTEAEVRSFVNSNQSNKRSLLIDHLLDSPSYVSNYYNKWADILRIRTTGRISQNGGNYHFSKWLKDALQSNMPYNDMVWEMVTSEGHPWENGATGFFFRDFGMPLDHMANTMQVFLGTQIACAQCHNHPYEKWTQKDFYELSAFTFGTKTGTNLFKDDYYKSLRNEMRKSSLNDKQKQVWNQTMRQLFDPLRYKVEETSSSLKLPSNYAYKDAKADSLVQAHVPFGEMPEITEKKTPAVAFAEWMTSTKNPRFSLMATNRVFSWMMGSGLIEPVDNIPPEDYESSMPELSKFLEEVFPLIDYDLKRLIRILANSELYNSQSHPKQMATKGKPFIPGKRSIRRMSAEQAWDSLMTILREDIDLVQPGPNRTELQYEAVLALVENYNPTQLVDQAVEFFDENKEIGDNKQKQGIRKIYFNLTKEFGVDINGIRKELKRRTKVESFPPNFIRASELPSPPQAGHFLETFGQSDRDLIENSNQSASIPQALELLNSSLINYRILHQSKLAKKWKSNLYDPGLMDSIFITLLSRIPTSREMAYFNQMLPSIPNNSIFEDITSGIINSKTFLFIE